jgi:hypothetical protein
VNRPTTWDGRCETVSDVGNLTRLSTMSTPESGAPVSAELVLRQLENLLASPQFSGSERLSAFLKFAVENALRNQPERLKEAVIAREIFGRETYDGNLDSVVRGAARRLREKLDEYYERADGLESVRITMPKGAYVPIFSFLSIARPLLQLNPSDFMARMVIADSLVQTARPKKRFQSGAAC